MRALELGCSEGGARVMALGGSPAMDQSALALCYAKLVKARRHRRWSSDGVARGLGERRWTAALDDAAAWGAARARALG